MSDNLPPSKFGAGYTVGGNSPQSAPPPSQPSYGSTPYPTAPPPPPPPQQTPYGPPPYSAPPPPVSPPPGSQWTGHDQPPGYPPPPLPAAPTNEFVAKLRSNKLALHALAGTLGGGIGALFAEVAPTDGASSKFAMVMEVGLWSAIFASVLATALFLSDTWHQRRELRPNRVLVALAVGAGAGFIAGAVAQALYSLDIGSFEFQNYVLRTFCWGLAGALIGGLLSRTVPNLGLVRGAAAGFVGGCVGGICFLLICNVFPEALGRICGIAALGLSLGLVMYVAETLFRDASLEIIWGPNETSRVGLGPQPITIGGGLEDDVYVPGLPPATSVIVLNNGLIEHIENYTGKRVPLSNGSQLQVGPIYLAIHARQ